MTIPILICDDSSVARKQMARSLPQEWDVEISYAANGKEAVSAIKEGKGDILFLDLNMPVMNGYEVLDAIRAQDLPTMVMVVSGDIQPDAYKRVIAKGALDFVQKPVTTEKIREVLAKFGIHAPATPSPDTPFLPRGNTAEASVEGERPEFSEMLQEVVNIAMGQAGSRLADLLGAFIRLPVPIVHICPYADLRHRLSCHAIKELSGVSHGFRGSGVSGEAILLLAEESFTDLMPLLHSSADQVRNSELGVLVDLSGLLIGACLQGISRQLDLDLNHGFPVLLGQRNALPDLLGSQPDYQSVVTVEINYQLPDSKVTCHLLLVFTADSIPALQERLELLQ